MEVTPHHLVIRVPRLAGYKTLFVNAVVALAALAVAIWPELPGESLTPENVGAWFDQSAGLAVTVVAVVNILLRLISTGPAALFKQRHEYEASTLMRAGEDGYEAGYAAGYTAGRRDEREHQAELLQAKQWARDEATRWAAKEPSEVSRAMGDLERVLSTSPVKGLPTAPPQHCTCHPDDLARHAIGQCQRKGAFGDCLQAWTVAQALDNERIAGSDVLTDVWQPLADVKADLVASEAAAIHEAACFWPDCSCHIRCDDEARMRGGAPAPLPPEAIEKATFLQTLASAPGLRAFFAALLVPSMLMFGGVSIAALTGCTPAMQRALVLAEADSLAQRAQATGEHWTGLENRAVMRMRGPDATLAQRAELRKALDVARPGADQAHKLAERVQEARRRAQDGLEGTERLGQLVRALRGTLDALGPRMERVGAAIEARA